MWVRRQGIFTGEILDSINNSSSLFCCFASNPFQATCSALPLFCQESKDRMIMEDKIIKINKAGFFNFEKVELLENDKNKIVRRIKGIKNLWVAYVKLEIIKSIRERIKNNLGHLLIYSKNNNPAVVKVKAK